jgi:hypothetical protein
MVFCFVQNFFFEQHKSSNFLLLFKARNFFPEFNIRLYDKNSESDYSFFLHQNQNIFFSNIGNQRFEQQQKIRTLVLFEKKILNETKNHNPPLQVKWSVPYSCYIYLFICLVLSFLFLFC